MFVTQHIGDTDIDILYCSAFFGLLTYFIIARKVVNNVNVIP